MLPNPQRLKRLALVGGVLEQFDVVGLQEVDGGSRSSRESVEYLAARPSFLTFQQLNRN